MFKTLLKVVAAPIYVPMKVVETVSFKTTDAVLTQIEKKQMTEITRKTAKTESTAVETKQEEKVRDEEITNIRRRTAETTEPMTLREFFNQQIEEIREKNGDDVTNAIVASTEELSKKIVNDNGVEYTVEEVEEEKQSETKENKIRSEYNEKLEKMRFEQVEKMKEIYENHIAKMEQQIENSGLSAETKEELKEEAIGKATETYNIEIENLEESVGETKEKITNNTNGTKEEKQETKDVIEIKEEIPADVLKEFQSC